MTASEFPEVGPSVAVRFGTTGPVALGRAVLVDDLARHFPEAISRRATHAC
jgi:hypothetical protein